MNLVEVRHEGVGLGMADGWARQMHAPGVCTATCGPGVTQLATAFVTAARAQSPLVAFCGEFPGTDQDYIQRFDQAKFADSCEAGFVRVVSPDYADEAVRKAFYLAKLESRPIMLSAPMDVQQKPFEDDEPYVPSSSLMPSPRTVRGDPESLRKAAEIIAASKKPVIVVGRGAMWSGAGDAVLKLGARVGALIATSLRAKNWLGDAEYHAGVSGLYSPRASIQLFEEADCVIAVGASMNRYTTEHGYLYPNAKYVHLDTRPHVTMAGTRSADCYVQTDARAGVEDLDKLLEEKRFKSIGYRTGDTLERLANRFDDRAQFEIESDKMDPREACRALEEIVPGDIGMMSGSGASAGFTIMAFNRPRPFAHAAHFFGCIGQMMPAAMGMCIATGRKPLLLVDGDASTIMHLSDFDTIVREKLPLLIVVLNDEALGSEYQKMRAHKMMAELSTVPSPDLGAIARAFGGQGVLARSVEEVRAAAAAWVKKPAPTIIDARISRNAITLPHRRVLYGRDE
ncbi:MAG: thiamine pyrophosphate-binding protein [Burkholderiales bacterium]|nr:thiamine pyrophosphate-binding protein [Burkholderiales bacterium]